LHYQASNSQQAIQEATPSDVAERAVVERLHDLLVKEPDVLTCAAGKNERAFTIYQYPARMVAPVQRLVMSAIAPELTSRTVLDPFVGSGTVLSEAMYLGFEGVGQDVNPLAVLLSRVRTEGFARSPTLAAEIERVCSLVEEDRRGPAHDFKYRDKWFRQDFVVSLSGIRSAIMTSRNPWIRRFLWVALAETVRRTSNSRTTTYKLHMRVASQLAQLPCPRRIFCEVARRNLRERVVFWSDLHARGLVRRGRYASRMSLRLRDSRRPIRGRFELVMTSPPYGDGTSTVPYGQASYLPLSWMHLPDINRDAGPDCLSSTYEIDRRALGGVKARGRLDREFSRVLDESPTLQATFERLRALPRDRASRVLSFINDLSESVSSITQAATSGGWLVWTVGNRSVGGAEVGLDAMLTELAEHRGARKVAVLNRRIPQKRMPPRNRISTTMRTERILIYRMDT
jgi:hypothetical protein